MYFARRMKLITHTWVMFHQYEVAGRSGDAALYCYLSIGRLGIVLARVACNGLLRGEKAAQQQQTKH